MGLYLNRHSRQGAEGASAFSTGLAICSPTSHASPYVLDPWNLQGHSPWWQARPEGIVVTGIAASQRSMLGTPHGRPTRDSPNPRLSLHHPPRSPGLLSREVRGHAHRYWGDRVGSPVPQLGSPACPVHTWHVLHLLHLSMLFVLKEVLASPRTQSDPSLLNQGSWVHYLRRRGVTFFHHLLRKLRMRPSEQTQRNTVPGM